MDVQINSTWKSLLKDEFEKPYFQKLTQEVKKEYQSNLCLPKGDEIFKAFDACPFDQLKVVILGQDPYPTPGHAHGLCFSVQKEVKPFPKSLNNIFKEIESDLGQPIPENGNLDRWAHQGVFLLNTVLTVRAGQTNSHQHLGWQNFTDKVIQLISEKKENVVFLLWGSQAQKKEGLLTLKNTIF